MNDIFLNDLRRALNHLYDPDFLRQSTLCTLFGITGPYERATKLQHILEEAIQALKPSAGQPAGAHRRRLYDLLVHRYVQQFSQKQVADELGISVSQLAREQQAALQALAMHLWEKYGLADRWQIVYGSTSSSDSSPVTQTTQSDDLSWIAIPSPEKQVDPKQILADVLQLAEPLLIQQKTQVKVTTPETIPLVAVYPVALRQVLLNLLSALLSSEGIKHIVIEGKIENGHVCLTIAGEKDVDRGSNKPLQVEREIDAARRIIELSGGKLTIGHTPSGKYFTLYLPVIGSIPILVIDDNTDYISLLQRYMVNTRYRLLAASDPERGLAMATQTKVAAIIIDIMMPRIDGWTVLQQLRTNPATAHCPILVCSILPLSALALSLGAHAFLGKPIRQQDLLMTLDRLTASQELELC